MSLVCVAGSPCVAPMGFEKNKVNKIPSHNPGLPSLTSHYRLQQVCESLGTFSEQILQPKTPYSKTDIKL